MNLFARQHTATQRDIEKVLGKKLSEATKQEILDLFPEYMHERWGKKESSLRLTTYPSPWISEKTWWQRMNCLWVFPFYTVFIGPVMWVVTGSFGVEPSSRVGNVLKKLIGE